MTAKILQLRCAVSYLYEQKAWWDTNFYDPDSKAFLSYIFPKSNNSQPSAAFDVFRHLIDKEVGSAYYHLFRLPVSMEEKMFQNLDYLSNFEFNSVNDALDFLSNTANGLTVIPDPSGVHRCKTNKAYCERKGLGWDGKDCYLPTEQFVFETVLGTTITRGVKNFFEDEVACLFGAFC